MDGTAAGMRSEERRSLTALSFVLVVATSVWAWRSAASGVGQGASPGGRTESAGLPGRPVAAVKRSLLAAAGLVVLALAGVAVFMRAQWAVTGNLWGVPVDDAYIHFRFVQNLATGHSFAFNPDRPEPGSTSPLWVLLLALPTFCGVPVWLAAKACGTLFLVVSAVLAWRLSTRYIAGPVAAWTVGALTALDGRLLWAAPSGMEVTLFAALSLAAFLARPAQRAGGPAVRRRLLLVAVLCGLATLARPEGYLLAAILFVDLYARFRPPLVAAVLPALALDLLLVAPYNVFALLTTGHPLPTTFYAKSVPLGADTLPRALAYLVVLVYLLVGGNFITVLAPLGAVMLWRSRPGGSGSAGFQPAQAGSVRGRDDGVRAVVAWPLLLIVEQALLSPVLYHFGRYVMPLQPFILLWAVAGIARLTRVSVAGEAWRAALPPLALVLVTALALGGWAQRYALSVRDIDGMQVALGHWVRAHVPAGVPVAAHDIGAIGYISGHPVVDIEGLVTPRFLLLKREQPQARRAADTLAEARRLGARYLIVFPRAYQSLVAQPGLRRVYSVTVPYPIIVQEPTMTVYEIVDGRWSMVDGRWSMVDGR